MDEDAAGYFNIDVLMPIKTLWEIDGLLRNASYLLANQEHMADVQEIYRQVFRLASPYAVSESDRTWLVRRSQGLSGTP